VKPTESLMPRTRTAARRCAGVSTSEYVLLLALIVIPLGIMTWRVIRPMFRGYVNRYTTVVRTPLG
jgi:hypothetical protein